MFIPSKPFISYKHLEDKTPKGLEVKMLKIQVASEEIPNFTPPTYANGSWHTWYLFDYSKELKSTDRFKMENE